jgi:hypothetical protein
MVCGTIGRLAILLIPIVCVLLPMAHFLPRIYNWAIRSRILRLYGELRLLEQATSCARGLDRLEMLAKLDRLEEQVNHLKVPALLSELRVHIDLVRGARRCRRGRQG